MSALDILSAVLMVCGLAFFGAGTVGLLRFPDVFTRLHALTKADNLGLGLLTLAAIVQQREAATMLKLAIIWLLVLIAGATSCYLVADTARRRPSEGRETH